MLCEATRKMGFEIGWEHMIVAATTHNVNAVRAELPQLLIQRFLLDLVIECTIEPEIITQVCQLFCRASRANHAATE